MPTLISWKWKFIEFCTPPVILWLRKTTMNYLNSIYSSSCVATLQFLLSELRSPIKVKAAWVQSNVTFLMFCYCLVPARTVWPWLQLDQGSSNRLLGHTLTSPQYCIVLVLLFMCIPGDTENSGVCGACRIIAHCTQSSAFHIWGVCGGGLEGGYG